MYGGNRDEGKDPIIILIRSLIIQQYCPPTRVGVCTCAQLIEYPDAFSGIFKNSKRINLL